MISGDMHCEQRISYAILLKSHTFSQLRSFYLISDPYISNEQAFGSNIACTVSFFFRTDLICIKETKWSCIHYQSWIILAWSHK